MKTFRPLLFSTLSICVAAITAMATMSARKIGGYENNVYWKWSPDARYVSFIGLQGFELRDALTGKILDKNAALHTDEFSSNSFSFSEDSSRIYGLMESL